MPRDGFTSAVRQSTPSLILIWNPFVYMDTVAFPLTTNTILSDGTRVYFFFLRHRFLLRTRDCLGTEAETPSLEGVGLMITKKNQLNPLARAELSGHAYEK